MPNRSSKTVAINPKLDAINNDNDILVSLSTKHALKQKHMIHLLGVVTERTLETGITLTRLPVRSIDRGSKDRMFVLCVFGQKQTTNSLDPLPKSSHKISPRKNCRLSQHFLLTNSPSSLKNTLTMPSGTNSQGNNYNTPGGTNSGTGGSYHCKFVLFCARRSNTIWFG